MDNQQKKKQRNKWLTLINIPIQMGIIVFLFSYLGRWLDEKYTNQDILSTEYVENKDGDKTYWNWPWIDIQYSPPYYKGMVCATRLSSNFLKCIKDYATKNNTLFFLEALFISGKFENRIFEIKIREFKFRNFR
jgi:hypothetical protein